MFVCVYVRMSVASCSFIPCTDLCDHPQNQDIVYQHKEHLPAVCFYPSTLPVPVAHNYLFSRPIIFSFWECYINGIKQYVTLRDWLYSLERHRSSLFPFHCWEIFHSMKLPQFVFPLTHWRTPGLFPVWGCYKQSCMNIHVCVCLGSIFKSATVGSYLHVPFFKKLPNCFPERLHHFTSPPGICEWFIFSTSSPGFGIVIIFYFSLSDTCIWISHYGSNLHFTND